MAAAKIPAFPYEQADYDYAGDALKKSWERLHRGDREPFPADAKLQSAWRAFHRGDFSKAIAEGSKLKASGATVASKSAAVAATYLVDDDKAAIRLLLEAAARADAATRESPGDANAWYMQAFVLGRYAQSVSVVKALAAGIGSKVKKALDRAIELEPKHADAHIALGLYHAEIIDKVGALAGTPDLRRRRRCGGEALRPGAEAQSRLRHRAHGIRQRTADAARRQETEAGGRALPQGGGLQAGRRDGAPRRGAGEGGARVGGSSGRREDRARAARTARASRTPRRSARSPSSGSGTRVGVGDQSELHLPGIGQDAEAEPDVPRTAAPRR